MGKSHAWQFDDGGHEGHSDLDKNCIERAGQKKSWSHLKTNLFILPRKTDISKFFNYILWKGQKPIVIDGSYTWKIVKVRINGLNQVPTEL